MRPSLRVLLICAKFGLVSSLPGSANCGVLLRLIASTRNLMRQSAPRLQSREIPALRLEIFPLRKVLRPRLPHISAGALINRKAERGSNWVELSGFPNQGIRENLA